MPTPVLVLCDAPNVPGGLARIARDLTGILYSYSPELDVDVAQLGIYYDGSKWPWHVYPVLDHEAWGRKDLRRVWGWHAQEQRGILFSIWDPSRCASTAELDIDCERWGYFAVDGANPNGKIGGLAGATLGLYDRILGYGDYGARVLKETTGRESIEWLPHGIDVGVFHGFHTPEVLSPAVLEAVQKWQGLGPETLTIGCVATNQPRKDLPTVFATAQQLGARLWLHTDRPVNHWSIPELADVYGFNDARLFFTTYLTDPELAFLYRVCDVTIAPGLGEGFGYPIVESLACGTPVVHIDWAGGAALTPLIFQQQVDVLRVEGTYAIERPVLQPFDTEIQRVVKLRDRIGRKALSAYCAGSVAHLDWKYLSSRWLTWFRRGFKEFREREEAAAAPKELV